MTPGLRRLDRRYLLRLLFHLLLLLGGLGQLDIVLRLRVCALQQHRLWPLRRLLYICLGLRLIQLPQCLLRLHWSLLRNRRHLLRGLAFNHLTPGLRRLNLRYLLRLLFHLLLLLGSLGQLDIVLRLRVCTLQQHRL